MPAIHTFCLVVDSRLLHLLGQRLSLLILLLYGILLLLDLWLILTLFLTLCSSLLRRNGN